MKDASRVIGERIRGEIEVIGNAQERALVRWHHALRVPGEQEAYLESAALNLQSFYTGLERIFSLIAERVDDQLPSGDAWHRDLLRQMAEPVPGIRPALVSHQTALLLDGLMRFRHLVRNIYAENLNLAEMSGIMETLPGLWIRLKMELSVFADFLLG